MGLLLDRLCERPVLVSDGAWGTMLQARGLGAGDCPEEWNVSHAEDVQSVASAYARAGSDMVLTNTFGGSRLKLRKMGHGERVVELNEAGARNSLMAAPDVIVAGSVGPTGEFLKPLGTVSVEEMTEVFSEQIAAMLGAGVKVVCVETMMAVEEAVCAVQAAKGLDAAVDVICTMTFDETPKGFRTMMGVSPERAAKELAGAGADVVGSNCGNGSPAMVAIAREFRRHTDHPILIQANAGLPEVVNGETIYSEGPADMAAQVKPLVEAGACIIGGCCGTTPEHIAAIREVVDAL